jgi:Holliday junction resolvase
MRGSGSKAGMVVVDGKKYYPIDIISVRKDKKKTIVWFIQVSKYLSDIDEIERKYLKIWAEKVGAEPILAWTFEKRRKANLKRGKWEFYNLNDNKYIKINKKDSK